MRSSTTHVRSYTSLLLGITFAAGTAYILLEDVHALADFTADHLMTMLVLLGTISAGHYFSEAVRQFRILTAIGLAILFAAGTFICVTGSASRGAQHQIDALGLARKINEQRETTERELEKANSNREQLQREFAKECSSGKGKKCDGVKATIEYADSHIRILQVRLDDLAPQQEENGGLRHAAKVFSLMLRQDAVVIEQGLVLLWPFAKALMLELATVVFFGMAMGHAVNRERTIEREPTIVLEPDAAPVHVQENRLMLTYRGSRTDAEQRILAHLNKHREIRTSEHALADVLELDRSTCRRAMLALEQQGRISLEASKRGTVLRLS